MAENTNLKTILAYFNTTNMDLARATDIDPSLISRYLSGNRHLKASSRQADAIAEYFMVHADTAERIEWIEGQLQAAHMTVDVVSMDSMKKCLIEWISSDGDVSSSIGEETDAAEEIYDYNEVGKQLPPANHMEFGVQAITRAISGLFVSFGLSSVPMKNGRADGPGSAARLERINRPVDSERLAVSREDNSVDVFLTSDHIRIFRDQVFAAMLHSVLADRRVTLNVVICVSGDTQFLTPIIEEYMPEMISGTMRFCTFFGMTQNVAEQLYFIFGHRELVMVTESPIGTAAPAAIFITDPNFVDEIARSFDASYRYSQPMFNMYNDAFTRNMIEIIYAEFCLPGSLDVVTDTICPMYMSYEAYCRVLRDANKDDAEYAWKCNEYKRFNDGFRDMLNTGMVCRELLSLKRLNQIATDGVCHMAGLYFLGSGFFDLDARGCREILKGYIDCLNRYPNFSLLILDDLPELYGCNCWHIKGNMGVAINDWRGGEPVMFHSVHSVLVQEIHNHYESIWVKGAGSLSNRAYMVSVLKTFIRRLDALIGDAD